MYVKAFGKLNLFLDVIGTREDGYHELDMVMVPVELHDVIEIEYLPYLTSTFVVCDRIEESTTKYDLIRKTLTAMKDKFGMKENFNITVHKEIPICAGMGGGSTNAAACIKAFSKIAKIKMTPEEELEFCLKLGADVPFCMKNVPAHVEGIGEKITPIEMAKQYYVIIIKPKKGLSTQVVFNEADKFKMKHGDVNKVIEALKTGNDDLLAESMFNSLEEVSMSLVPEIKEIKDMFIKDGLKCSMMTGSGSCVFALATDKHLARKCYDRYDRKGYEVYLTRTLKC